MQTSNRRWESHPWGSDCPRGMVVFRGTTPCWTTCWELLTGTLPVTGVDPAWAVATSPRTLPALITSMWMMSYWVTGRMESASRKGASGWHPAGTMSRAVQVSRQRWVCTPQPGGLCVTRGTVPPALALIIPPSVCWASLVAQLVKNLPAMQETQVSSLGQKDPLEKEMATHSRVHA